MAFAIPSLQDLTRRARLAFRSYLPGTDAQIAQNNAYVIAKVLAGVNAEVFHFIAYVARQIFAATADSEFLDRHGAEIGLARRPAAPSAGYVDLTCAGAVTVAAGAVLSRLDGVQYRALSDASIAGTGDLSLEVVAVADGTASNSEGGTALSVVSGVTGDVTAVTVAAGGIVAGADVEDDESFRARILFRKRNPPHGGSAADYVMWATSVSGVTRAFVERLHAGAGTVRVFVLMDTLYPNGIAPVAEIERVADYIEAVRPAGAIVTVAAPRPRVIDIQIAGLTPDNLATREAIVAGLRAAFARLSRVAGQDVATASMPYLARPSVFSRSWIWQTIANASGEESHRLNLPLVDVQLSPGEIAVLGTVTFVP
jgi:uncharacterized phage protein gp47/JayE